MLLLVGGTLAVWGAAGADRKSTTKDGLTALALAAKYGHTRHKGILEAAR